jgi:hypothetical protein
MKAFSCNCFFFPNFFFQEFKSTTSDFAQQLQNSGVQYRETFEAAKENFSLPPNITPSQAHFLLSNRSIQKQLTRKPNFDMALAKDNIATFLSTVNTVEFEHLEHVAELQNFHCIVCFTEFDWEQVELPKNCIIMDFCNSNDSNLGQNIPVAWNIKVITKKPQIPVNGNLPLISQQLRVYWLSGSADEDNGEIARALLQQKAEEQQIKVANIMDISEIKSLLKFIDEKSNCLLIEPPLEWSDIFIGGLVEGIKELQKISVVARNSTAAKHFEEKLSEFVSRQWREKAEQSTATVKTRKRKIKQISSSTSTSSTIPPPSSPAPSPTPSNSQPSASPSTTTAVSASSSLPSTPQSRQRHRNQHQS